MYFEEQVHVEERKKAIKQLLKCDRSNMLVPDFQPTIYSIFYLVIMHEEAGPAPHQGVGLPPFLEKIQTFL
ncbi:hypothetical protein XELAEV_18034887mg [Xenopus laevis]|uniref:Uncharacterized protein n=1 Tax=Xenopus laevis TaxID=8355 RepID=A0A974CFZ4_XENLA|nr:hypothetical protein XELAEV_18034887mg [Xenopus laevis]